MGDAIDRRGRERRAGRRAGRIGAALVAGVLALGCEGRDRNAGSDQAASGEAASGAEAAANEPILPDAPWFKIPDGWAQQHPTLSPNARTDVHFMALAERQVQENPADSAGRVWLRAVTPIGSPSPAPPSPPRSTPPSTPPDDAARGPGADEAASERPSLPAASRQRFELVFEVGEPGIDEGGSIFVLPDPFWGWSEAQTDDPAAPGYTTATLREPSDTAVRPARLAASELPGAFRVEGRALVAGERIDIVYGAGTAGATVDRYAERGAELRIGLDADGDGQREWLPESAAVDIVSNAGDELVAFGPAEVAPGERFELNLALVDAVGNHARWPAASLDARGRSRAELVIESLPAATVIPSSGVGPSTSVAPADGPHRATLTAPATEGTIRLRAHGVGALDGFEAELPPIVVRRAKSRLVWADLHGHSRYSDGSGDPDDYFRYARDVARLDVVALTDHDHWGLSPLDESPDRQAEILARARAHHVPGRFVTLPGYEWTSWLHGHRHVLSFDDTIAIHSSIAPETDRPDELWAALRGRPVLTFAHHSAGEPVATNWNFAPDPELEPVTEIASVHGMSEAADAPAPIGEAIEGNFVRDVLRYGARLGFVGSGDSHDGHPGLAAIAAGQGGLAGIFTTALDREPLLAALKSRHTFATNGIRPWLEVSIDGVEMGGTLDVPVATAGSPRAKANVRDLLLRIRFEATAPIASVELVRTGHVAKLDLAAIATSDASSDAKAEGSGTAPIYSLDFERRIPPLSPGEFHYVRIVQADGGVAWSSPIFVQARREATRAATATALRSPSWP